MQKYAITDITSGECTKLITILDGDVSAGELLPSVIAEAEIRNETVVADMLLLGGMGQFRFVALSVDGDGDVDFASAGYADATPELVRIVDGILGKSEDSLTWFALSRMKQNEEGEEECVDIRKTQRWQS